MTTQDSSNPVDIGAPVPLETPTETEVEPPSLTISEFDYPPGEAIALPTSEDAPLSPFERLIDESELLPIWFLEQGVVVQRSVARVVLTKAHTVAGRTYPPGTGWATGFMVSPSLFLTNNHVIPNAAFADKIRMQFNYQKGPEGVEQPHQSSYPIVDEAFVTNRPLDFTLIRLKPLADVAETILPGDQWGVVKLNPSPTFLKDQHFNIIQHPKGRHKEVSLQDNEIYQLYNNVVRYKSDTQKGSSGSPVFDNLWRLVALHHAGGDRDADGKWLSNEGIRIDKIIKHLRDHFTDDTGQAVLAELGI